MVGAAKFVEDLGVFLPADADLVGRGHEGGESGPPGRRIDRAAGKAEHEHRANNRAEEGLECPPHSSNSSICSGWVASIIGPLKDLIQPLTRM